MENFFLYSLKILIASGLLWFAYRFFIAGNTFHKLNRVVLLASYVMMIILPLFTFSFIENIDYQPSTIEITTQTNITNEIVQSEIPTKTFTFDWQWLIGLYFVGLLVVGVHQLLSNLSLWKVIHSARKTYWGETKLFVSTQQIAPFSWFDYIVINHHDLTDENHDIISHEMAHVRLWHSADMILVQCLCVFLWWNPFVWLLKKELATVHEYQADSYALQHSSDANSYRKLLIKRCVGNEKFALAHHFESYNLKHRLNMTFKKQSSNKARWNYAFIALAIFFSATIFSAQPLKAQEKTDKKSDLKKTIHDPDDKLYIFNGKEVDSAIIKQISPDSIGRMVVLKDKQAVELYGEKGKNGVIIINSKSSIQLYVNITTNTDNQIISELTVFKNGNVIPFDRDNDTDFLLNGKKISIEQVRQLDGTKIRQATASAKNSSTEDLHQQLLKAGSKRNVIAIVTD